MTKAVRILEDPHFGTDFNHLIEFFDVLVVKSDAP